MATSLALPISSYARLIANASRRPLSFDPPSTPFSARPIGLTPRCSMQKLLQQFRRMRSEALASRITQVRLLTDLSSSVEGFLHGVFPPTYRSVVRTPSFGIQVHWPGRCFAPSPALLCYHALPHILLCKDLFFIHGRFEHQPKFGKPGNSRFARTHFPLSTNSTTSLTASEKGVAKCRLLLTDCLLLGCCRRSGHTLKALVHLLATRTGTVHRYSQPGRIT